MAQDIYNFNATYKGAPLITASEMKLIVANADGSGEEYLIQNISCNYARPTQVIREISTGNGYLYGFPPQGTLTIERIIGKKPLSAILGTPGTGIWKVTDNNATNRTIKIIPINGTGPKYTLEGCVMSNYTLNMDANSGLVRESGQITFGKATTE